MATRPALLKQSDLTRYLKAMRAAGVTGRVEADPRTGRHIIVFGEADIDLDASPNPCDRLLK
ncbi:hypothetical protein Rumeso_01735 [Rubellimicrobium mesophilum DSM 19309]|uniref:Uncharacterized protein n=1 Tax=Rubellimicrobium mesophilum DSM 19309 TaxID=442562 RepID=A0A017HQI7_9RHOB|nr:hypothetical protein [Rubellimicrobium mesophilum]EYD76777.1 hypothetical protein Rumeso_01735 [Rubellimicrobium mesophilum DSM 19309]